MRVINSRTLLFLAVAFATLHAQTIAPADAKSNIGANATVCGIVASEHTAARAKGQPTFLNLDQPYPRQVFTALIWSEDRASVGPLPRVGERACVHGVIVEYRGQPQILVHTASQLTPR